ncbi:hypothetical protein KC730_03410 [Candidatus Kaiserbacteria bacterium]|nr:hypothetical protein [Candidatus Kaiserbacteria bacterium]
MAGSEVVDDVVEVVREEISPAGQLANNASAKTNTDDRWTYLALAGVLLLGTVSVYVKPKSNEKR